MGPAGSGKDSFMKALIDGKYIFNAKPIISCTTRPIRENEQDGVNYHFLTNEEFAVQILNGDMLEATMFNNWFYGTSVHNLDDHCVNIGVFNPEAIEILQTTPNVDLYIVYLVSPDKERLLRQLNREEHPNCDEIIRRYGADKIDFNESRIDAIHPDLIIDNDSTYTIEELVDMFSGVLRLFTRLGEN